MRLSRSKSAALGVVTFVPLLYMILFVCYLWPRVAPLVEGDSNAVPIPIPGVPEWLFPIHGLAVALSVLLLAFYCTVAAHSSTLVSRQKRIWLVVLLVGNILAMPVFWYRFMWSREGKTGQSQS